MARTDEFEERLDEMRSSARALARPDAAAHLTSLLAEVADNAQRDQRETDHGRH